MMVPLETTSLDREEFSTAPPTSLGYFGVDGDKSEKFSRATDYSEHWSSSREVLTSALKEVGAESHEDVCSNLLSDCAQAFASILTRGTLQENSAPSQDVVLALDIVHIGETISDERDCSEQTSKLPFNYTRMTNLFKIDPRAELNVWRSIALIDHLPRIQMELDEYGAHATAMQYFVIVTEILESRQFASTENYRDVFGSWVADYFRGEERITCAVSRECVQVLSFLDDNLDDMRFELSDGAKESLVRYLEELVL